MIAAEIIRQVLDAGGQIAVDGADLVLTAARPLPPDLLDSLKVHKPAILAALARPDPLPPVPRGLGSDELLARLNAELPKPRAPANLEEVLAAASDGTAGITPEQFRSLLSPEDLADIEAGAIPVATLRGYALSFADGNRAGRIVVPDGEP